MRKWNANERRLVLILGSIFFVILNLILVKWFLGQTQQIKSRIATLESSARDYESIMAERPHWEARQAWMHAMPMDAYTGAETDSRFAEAMQQSLTQHGLAIESQQLHESELRNEVVVVTLDLTVKGQLEQIVRWMQQMQQPGKYFAIPSIILKRSDESSNMSVRMSVSRFFRRGGIASSP